MNNLRWLYHSLMCVFARCRTKAALKNCMRSFGETREAMTQLLEAQAREEQEVRAWKHFNDRMRGISS